MHATCTPHEATGRDEGAGFSRRCYNAASLLSPCDHPVTTTPERTLSLDHAATLGRRLFTPDLVRDGILVGLQTNRETAHLLGERESRGCTFATSWRNYPFLRMPTVHVEPGGDEAPSAEEIIAHTKDGILIDGRGSYSIDQQRHNGQFGGDAFRAIKNGRKTRMVADVTYTAITTDVFSKLDAVGHGGSSEMFGRTGDAKGQPVQINYISHGPPWMRIRQIMVGAAYL
jgi:TldD protein